MLRPKTPYTCTCLWGARQVAPPAMSSSPCASLWYCILHKLVPACPFQRAFEHCSVLLNSMHVTAVLHVLIGENGLYKNVLCSVSPSLLCDAVRSGMLRWVGVWARLSGGPQARADACSCRQWKRARWWLCTIIHMGQYYVYTYIHVYICICIYTCIYTYTHLYIYIYV